MRDDYWKEFIIRTKEAADEAWEIDDEMIMKEEGHKIEMLEEKDKKDARLPSDEC